MDTAKYSSFADYFVICNGESGRQINAIYEEIRHQLKEAGAYPRHCEGTVDSGWLLIDYGDVIVHIFSPEERQNYQLDKLWSRANILLKMQ